MPKGPRVADTFRERIYEARYMAPQIEVSHDYFFRVAFICQLCEDILDALKRCISQTIRRGGIDGV